MSDLELLLVIVAIIATGVGLFFVSGFIYVPKKRIAIIEVYFKYFATKKHGFYYFLPLKARRVGAYKITTIKEEVTIHDVEYVVYYKIIDFKTYHYSGHELELFLFSMDEKNISYSPDTLKQQCVEFGIVIEEIIKR